MNLSVRTRIAILVTVAIIAFSVISTTVTTLSQQKSMEREIIARGKTLSEALSHAVDEALAAEDLNFIVNVEHIVHTRDMIFAQIFTDIWLPIDAYPADRFETPPDARAKTYFEKNLATLSLSGGDWYEFYSPVFFHRTSGRHEVLHKDENRQFLIGYVRLRIAADEMKQALIHSLRNSILLSLLLTAVSIAALNALLRKIIIAPIITLQQAVSRHKDGELPGIVPVASNDELGRLAAEFNEMTTAIREREERIAQEKERLAVTLRSIGDAVIVTDTEGIITMMNRVAERHTGWSASEATGKALTEVFNIINEKTHERAINPVAKVIASGQIEGLANHTALIRKDGSEITIEDSAAPIRDSMSQIIGVVLVFRDMTEKKRIEEELLKAEKLQSIGLLAGGIAHDFNNLLTSIVGNVSMAKLFINDRQKVLDRLADAETATKRATDLTYQLLTFSKGGAPVKKVSAIDKILRESARFTLSGTAVAPRYIIPETPWPVDIDSGQMSQVFNNLIINAVHAMPEGGSIVFTVANTIVMENELPELPAGNYVRVSVADSGIGIPKENLGRIFDPYFTTKQKGSGLGLASAYSIVRNHDGHIAVESTLGKGTIFHIHLPVAQGAADSDSTDEKGWTTGSGRILIMDDEQLIRDIATEMLRSIGYDVAPARDGGEAVRFYKEAMTAGRPFDAVILDLTIPGGLGGKETIRQLRAFDPSLKAIVSSGYSNDPIMADYRNYGFKGVVVKPYDIAQFSKTVRDVING